MNYKFTAIRTNTHYWVITRLAGTVVASYCVSNEIISDWPETFECTAEEMLMRIAKADVVTA